MTNIVQLTQNMEDLEEFEPLPRNWYRATCVLAETRASEGVPDGYFYLQFVIPVDEYPVDYDPENNPEGTQLTYARVRIPTERRYVRPFKNMMAAFDLPTSGTEVDLDAFIDKQVLLLVEVSEYNGQPNNQIAGIKNIVTV
jgi:hypothetical protein